MGWWGWALAVVLALNLAFVLWTCAGPHVYRWCADRHYRRRLKKAGMLWRG